MAETRIALGMSGGVDSSVAVELLQRAGYEVIGVTCRFHDDARTAQALADAAVVCERFGIEHVVWDCMEVFEQNVVRPFVGEYAAGRTPSPCVGCNATTKIPALMAAADAYGCEKIATGHYARVARMTASGRYAIMTALDARKDQSYMLCMLTQEQLSRLVLPLGAMTKAEVRIMAAELGLAVAEKAESQDVCFIEGDYRPFLCERGLVDEPGDIVNMEGVAIGQHTGLSNYTVGQRKGIGLAAPEPYYVIAKRIGENQLVVGFAADAKVNEALVGNANWQAIAAPFGAGSPSAAVDCSRLDFERSEEYAPLEAMVKLRYRSEPAACVIEPVGEGGVAAEEGVTAEGRVRVRLRSPQAVTAPGQYAVFYQGSTVLGGGVIEEVFA